MALDKSCGVLANCIPRPPPPADAFISTGKPILSATIIASSVDVMAPSEPGMHGMPRFKAAFFASILSPIMRMCSDFGPIKVNPWSSTISAKSGFSDKNPTPGCIASAPVIVAADIIAGIFR